MKRKIKPRPHDNNVKMLYHLENNALYKGAKFSSVEQIQSYVDFITGSNYWRRCSEDRSNLPGTVKVFSNGDNDFSQQRYPNEIWMAIKHWDQQVVLHELAHFFEDNHGPGYVRHYLNLIAQFMGLEIAAQYRRAFNANKIKF